MPEFFCSALNFRVSLDEMVAEKLSRFRQTNCFSREAGGMLFTSELDDSRIEISYASPPTRKDVRSYSFFRLDERGAQTLINEQFRAGHHYIGDWHTHDQRVARPSHRDKTTIRQIFIRSDHERPILLMLIVSSSREVSSWFLSATDGKLIYEFEYVE